MDGIESIALKNKDENYELDNTFKLYIDDYCEVGYLEDIKENDMYLINKWKLIFFHCVKLDDYFFI